MKKSAAILIAAFYLLLITGAYACVLTCGSNHLIDRLASKNASLEGNNHEATEKHDEDKNEKHCDGDADCSCCKKHGSYSVKENLKPDNSFQVSEIPTIAVNNDFLAFNSIYSCELTASEWPKINAPPPPGTSPPIFIKLHSLLI